MNTTTAVRNPFPVLTAGAIAILAFAGFARSYYLKFLFDAPPLTVAMHLHGLLATLWIALHFIQARLIAAHRVRLHMTLGIAGAVLGALVVVQAFDLSVHAAIEGRVPPGRNPLQFLAVSLTTTVLFGGFVAAALLLRRRPEWHKRLMFLATAGLLLPAVGRLDALWFQPLGMPRAITGPLIITALIVWGCVNDWRRRGGVHPAYLIGGTLLVASFPARIWYMHTEAWMAFARWITT